MLSYVIFYIFLVVGIINVTHFGLYAVGANFYDINRFRADSRRHKTSKRPRPLISVLIPAHNEEKSIVRCLESIRKSTYRKFEIIVVDDYSSDRTKHVVLKYIREHPQVKVRLMFKRKNVGKGSALNHALKHGARGDLVMTLDADSMIHRKTISNAVKYFDNPGIVGVAANVRVMESRTILGLLQKYEYLIGYRSKKVFSVTNCEFIVGGVASVYRREIIKELGYYDHDIITEDIALSLKVVSQGNKVNRVVYGVDVLAYTEGVQTFKALMRQRYRWKMGGMQSIVKYRNLFGNTDKKYSPMLTYYRMPMAFLGEFLLLTEPVIILYVIYCCILLGSINLVVGAYVIISLYLSWNILFDEHMIWREKLKMVLYVPVMYFIFYTMNVVQFSAMVKCLWNYRQVLRKVETKSTWKSPERQGQLTSG